MGGNISPQINKRPIRDGGGGEGVVLQKSDIRHLSFEGKHEKKAQCLVHVSSSVFRPYL